MLVSCLCGKSFAQQKDFESVVYYTAEVKSKAAGVSDKDMMTMIGMGDRETVYIKQGNYRQVSGFTEVYYISKKEKVYYKFKKIDTLFYLDYSFDTSNVISVSKTDDLKSIAGYECKSITIASTSGTSKYFYAPLLHMNPEYDRNNTIGNFNIYTKETGSIMLGYHNETGIYALTETCTRVEPKAVDETVFDLPKLPEQKFTVESIKKPAEFKRGGEAGWIKYLQANINTSLGPKYIKIPKGEKDATETVQLSFIISETGEVTDIKVLNKEEVHSKLAEEAVRVVKESYGWKPGTMYGEKISFMMKQGITFQVTKQ